jgi:indolepyruvate ferredoxin oxidoreductase beta subunit
MNHLPAPTNLIITGVGGQGNVLAARLLASVILSQGLEVTVGDVYGLTQRGGSVASHVRWTGSEPLPPLVPRNSLDILVAFEPMEGLRILSQFGNMDTKAIVNATPVTPIGVQAGRFSYPQLDDLYRSLKKATSEIRLVRATDAARRIGLVQVLNLIMLGALAGSGFIGNGIEIFEDIIKTTIAQRYVEINLRAFREGIRLIES